MGDLMELNLEDLAAVPSSDLELVYAVVSREIDRRLSLDVLQQQATVLAEKYEMAIEGKPSVEYTPGTVVGPGQKVTQDGIEYKNVSKAWLSASPAEYPLGYRRMTAPAEPVKLWVVGEDVIAGDLRRKNGVVYQCITGHTTAAHWAPDLPGMTALWIPAVEPAAGRKAKNGT